MGYGDEKVVVDVKDIDDGELLYTDKNGQQHTYYPCRNTWLDVQTLEVVTSLREPQDEGSAPRLVTQVRGKAALEDRSISVVGDPASKVRVIEVSFEAGDWQPKPPKAGEDEVLMLTGNLGGAMLGFNRRDWEIGNDDQWWAACYLPQDFMDRLIAEVRGGQMRSMKFGLRLRHLWTTEHSYAPVSSRGDLFLRPDKKDNSIGIPEMATGHVWSIHFSAASRDLRVPEPDEPMEVEEVEPQPEPPNQVAVAVAALSTRLDQVRSTLKWVGGFIVVALMFVAGR